MISGPRKEDLLIAVATIASAAAVIALLILFVIYKYSY